jgi:hypothetical protein
MFWADPFNTPLTWIALLYGIVCLTTQADNFRNLVIENSTSPSTPIPSLPPSRPKYLDQVEQSLIAGNYSNGGPFALEALLHYHVIEHTRYPDADVGTWLLTGMITRLGLRMGYHRDPSHFPNISPFQGEIRRRVWVLIHALDVMMSLQLGLPRVIKDGHWDTIPPRNLYDSEFDEDTLELPPSRPENEATPTLHLIAKHKLLVVIGTIADTSMMTTEQGSPSALAAEKRLTARLREAYESAPPHVKFDPISRFLTNNASEIMNRLSTTLLLQKGLIVLNWHHVMPRGSTPGLNFDLLTSGHEKTNEEDEGYRVCIEASLEILKLQEIVDYETQPGGMLFTLHLLLYSVVKHEFLMAATVLITHMFRTIASHSESQVVHENKMLDQEVILALRKSHGIWIRQSGRSREAMRVTNLLTMLFQKLEDLDVQQFCENATLEDFTVMQSDNAGLALFGEFGLLHHLEDLSTFMNLPAT